jgi:uncharacterized membrane protein
MYGGYCGYLLAYFNQNISGWIVLIILALNAFVFAFLIKFITNIFINKFKGK